MKKYEKDASQQCLQTTETRLWGGVLGVRGLVVTLRQQAAARGDLEPGGLEEAEAFGGLGA